jgi:hypothetical protein
LAENAAITICRIRVNPYRRRAVKKFFILATALVRNRIYGLCFRNFRARVQAVEDGDVGNTGIATVPNVVRLQKLKDGRLVVEAEDFEQGITFIES